MKVNVLGGGPAGLYAALLLKQAHPAWEIAVTERNPEGATYGWGVVFSDRTLTELREADPETYREITDAFVLWEAIDVNIHDTCVRCEGHTFAGIARRHLLDILARRCAALGVPIRYLAEMDDIDALRADADLLIAADGVNSRSRARYAETFRPRTTPGRNRFIWFGTDKVFDSFTFIFRDTEHGLFQVHAYPFDGETSTFIVECAEETWRRTGLGATDEAASVAFCESLFADHLAGRHLLSNRSHWLTFLTLRNARWSHENVVLLGDAAHTAHFSIGSGTKLAMEDAIALAQAFATHDDRRTALRVYELSRKPRVEGIQRAAAESQRYFEHTKRYHHFAPLPFAFNLLTRSGRITYDSLRPRDPRFIADVERWFAASACGGAMGGTASSLLAAPPMYLTPLALRGATLPNRVVAIPPPTAVAADGQVSDADAARIVETARGGAGLILTQPVPISAEGRVTPNDSGLYRAEYVEAWTRIVDAVHRESSAKIGLTLNHAGRRGASRPRSEGVDRPLREGAWPLIAPSPLSYTPVSRIPKEMDCADMERVRAAFVQAARWAADANFDLLQLHMAHGYLLAQFLSPLTNRRADEYGGSLENRMRFPLAVLDAVRAVWPEERPLAVALSATDWAKGGGDVPDAVIVARALKEHGCDLVTVLAGQTVPDAEPRHDFEALAGYSDIIRNEAGIPTLATPYMTTSGPANTLLAGGRADLCLMHPSR